MKFPHNFGASTGRGKQPPDKAPPAKDLEPCDSEGRFPNSEAARQRAQRHRHCRSTQGDREQ